MPSRVLMTLEDGNGDEDHEEGSDKIIESSLDVD